MHASQDLHDAPDLAAPQKSSVRGSLAEYGRGLAGGLLFSLPLLYTMEMWDMGQVAQPLRLLAGIGGTFFLLLGYNRYAGLRCDAGLREVMIDSVEELGLGFLLAAGLLALLGVIDAQMSAPEIIGKIVVEGLAVAIGVSVGTAQLGGDSPGLAGDPDGDKPEQPQQERGGESSASGSCIAREPSQTPAVHSPAWLSGQLSLALCGAVLVAASIAPTDEIHEISVRAHLLHLLALTGLTLGVGALVLYSSGFRGATTHVRHRDRIDVVLGTVSTYLVSMIASAALLWFFGRFDGEQFDMGLAQTIVLALPTAIGASAGRLLLQSS